MMLPLQKALAKDITIRVHSEKDYSAAVDASEILFGKGTTETLKKLSEEMLLAVFEGVPQSNISKSDLLTYLEETENLLSKELKSLENDDFMKEDGFTFQGLESVLQKLIHLLRHTMHHIGELNKTLRDIECNRINWL